MPKIIKMHRGTYRPDRAKNEPTSDKFVDREPPWWLHGRLERKAWREFHDWLSKMGVLTVADQVAFEMLVRTYVKWREAAEKAKVGIYKTQTGYVSHNPLINVENRYAKELRALLSEFGMTPSSRSRINLPESKDDIEDPMEKLLNEV